MKLEHEDGENKGKIVLYALSTCGWCRKTKDLLKKIGVEYSYVYVDLLEGEDRDEAMKQVAKWNPRRSYPTIVINDEVCVSGYKEDEIKKVLKL
jgi:glutaredoxin